MEKNGQSFYYQSGRFRLHHRNHQSKRRRGSALCVFVVRQDRVAARSKLRAAIHVYGEGVGYGERLYYFRARFYDSAMGRFISEDPKGFAAGVNFYGYVSSNPIGRVDPYGLDWLDNLSNFSAGSRRLFIRRFHELFQRNGKTSRT